MAPSTCCPVSLWRADLRVRSLGLLGEEIPQPLAHRVGRLRRPFAKAFAGAHAELAGCDLVLDELGRLGRAVEIGQQHVLDVEGEIDADQVGLLHRAEHRHARAEAAFDHLVDGVGVADAGRDQRDRLALQGMLQPVADEARDVLLDMHRISPGVAQQRYGLSHRLVAGLFVLRHFDQRNEMRRIPEMRADHALAVLELLADPRRGNGRAVAGEDRVRRGQVFKLGEELLLERQLFRRGFEHERHVPHRRRHLVMRGNAAEQRRIAAEQRAGALQPFIQGVPPLG